jgi:hypothetical protein
LIAVVASLFLVLYVLVPGALFRLITSITLPVKKYQKTQTQEITFAVVSTFLPFWVAAVLVWTVAVWPFSTNEGLQQRRAAYRTVYAAIVDDKQMDDAVAKGRYWPAVNSVLRRQSRFLVWYYLMVCAEAWLFWWLATRYRIKGKRWRDRIGAMLLPPVISEWHALLTPFGRNRRAEIELDVLSTDGILYQGGLEDYFFNTEGDLSGVLLKKAARYDRIQYSAHQQADFNAVVQKWPEIPSHKFTRESPTYWRSIPGADLFYIPRERIANLNVRHVTPREEIAKATQERLEDRKITGYAIAEQPQQLTAAVGKVTAVVSPLQEDAANKNKN